MFLVDNVVVFCFGSFCRVIWAVQVVSSCFCLVVPVGSKLFLLFWLILYIVLHGWFFTSFRLFCIVVCCFGMGSIVLGCVKLAWICFLLSVNFSSEAQQLSVVSNRSRISFLLFLVV